MNTRNSIMTMSSYANCTPRSRGNGAAFGGRFVRTGDETRDQQRFLERFGSRIAGAHALGETPEERRVPVGVGGILAHAGARHFLGAPVRDEHDARVIGHDLSVLTDEAEANLAPP